MNKYPIIHNNKNNEETIIKAVPDSNKYPQNTIQQNHKPAKKNNEQKRKWVAFTFLGPESRTITKLFKNTEVGTSYRTKNNVKHLLRTKENNNGKCNLSGVCQLQCADCPRKYCIQGERSKQDLKNT
jgi:ribosomal protein L35